MSSTQSLFRIFFFFSIFLGLSSTLQADPDAPVTYLVLLGEDVSVSGGGGYEWEVGGFPKFGPDGTGWLIPDWSRREEFLVFTGESIAKLTGPNAIEILFLNEDLPFGPIRQFYPQLDGITFGATPKDEDRQSIYAGSAAPQIIEMDGLFEYADHEGSVLFTDVLESGASNYFLLTSEGEKIKLAEFREPTSGAALTTFDELGAINGSINGHVAFFAAVKTGDLPGTDWTLFELSDSNEVEFTSVTVGGVHPTDPLLSAGGEWQGLDQNKALFSMNGQGVMAFKAGISSDVLPSGGATSVWRKEIGQDPTLVAVEGVPMTTDIGEVQFSRLEGAAAKLNPAVDADGNVFFHGRGAIGQDSIGEALWKREGDSISLVTVFNELPIKVVVEETGLDYIFEDKEVDVQRVSISDTGRVAIVGTLQERNRAIASVLWAQDVEGDFIVVATRNFSNDDNNDGEQDLIFEREQLVVAGAGGRIGKLTGFFTTTNNFSMIGGEDRMGDSWWTPDEFVMFAGTVFEDGEVKRNTIQAFVGELDLEPSGDTYIWDGGAGTDDWHTVDGERSNWTDAFGARWPTPPGSGEGNEKCIIGTNFAVKLNSAVKIDSLTLQAASLEINAFLEFTSQLEIDFLSELDFRSGQVFGEAGTAKIDGGIKKSSDSAASIEVLTLNLFESEIQVEAGTLTFENVATSFDKVNAVVTDGLLDLKSEVQEIDGDTILDAKTVDGTIYLGSGTFTTPLIFEGGTPSDKRTLELNGEGRIEIRRPMTISNNNELVVNNTAPWEREGVVINLPAGQVINVTDEWFFRKEMRLQRGGITGNFWNGGVLIVKAEGENENLQLGGTNIRRIQQYSNVEYSGTLKNRPSSTYQIFGGDLRPANEEADTLIFEERGQLWVEDGEVVVDFGKTEDRSFGEFVEVRGASHLALLNAIMKGHVTISVLEEAGEITLENTVFDKLFIDGAGKTTLSDVLKGTLIGGVVDSGDLGLLSIDPVFNVRTSQIEFKGATLMGIKDGIRGTMFNVGDFKRPNIFKPGTAPRHMGTLNGLTIGEGAIFVNTWSTKLTSEAPIVISEGQFENAGHLVLESGIFAGDPPGQAAVFNLGFIGPGILEVAPEIEEPITIQPRFALRSNNNEVKVGDGSRLFFQDDSEFELGEELMLPRGEWTIGDGASLIVLSEDGTLENTKTIMEISRNASLSVGSESPDFRISNGFSTRFDDLTVKGKLRLRNGAILDMEGRRILIEGEGDVISEEGSEIKGAVNSVTNQLRGTLSLAGLITENSDLNGRTQMGASPGTGEFGGDVVFGEDHLFEVEIGGTEAGLFDKMLVAGTVTLNGKMTLFPWEGYDFVGNEQLALIEGSSISGNFVDIDQSRLGRDVRFDFEVSDTGLMATAMPLVIESYADWRAAFFTQSNAADDLISGPDQDPDRDGMSNRLEYLLDRNPNVPEGSPVRFALLETETSNQYLVAAVFDRLPGVTDAVWSFETSTDLAIWIEVDATETGQTANGDFVTSIVNFNEAVDISGRIFIRMTAKEIP